MNTEELLKPSVVLKMEVITLNRKIAKQIRMATFSKVNDDSMEEIKNSPCIGWVARDAIEDGSFTAELHLLLDGTLWFLPVDFQRVTGPQIFVA